MAPMADSEATTLEGEPLNQGFLPVEPAPVPSPRPLLRAGRWAAALGAAAVLALVVFAVVRAGQERDLFPPGIEVKADLDATVELVASNDVLSAMLDAVNLERQRHGLSDLCYNQKLLDVAQAHSEDMAAHSHMSHTGSDGSSAGQRIKRGGYSWNLYAENVASGQTSVSHVMHSWMNSAGHRANILTNGISHFGMGRKNNFWTQVFASPSGAESCMLAGGGEDGHGGQCRDVVPQGQDQWHDSDGPKYHCDWYAQGNGENCKAHGHKFSNFGYTASQACCACGGGEDPGSNGCMDKALPEGGDWYDADGKHYHCDWYGAKHDRCSKHGNSFRNFGMVANQACCACGGGTNMADLPSGSSGSHAAAPNKKCCSEQCASNDDCADRLFCCPFHKLCMGRDTHSTGGRFCNECR